jgi:hypothetical protein
VKLPDGAIYLYAISAERMARPRSLPVSGVDGSGRVIAVPCGAVTAWVSAVDAGSFADALEQNIENLDWLAEATLRHQKAVSAIAERAAKTLLPTRFGVVFSGVEVLQQDIAQRQKAILAATKCVEGCEEWGVKVFQVAPRATNAAFKTAASGADYLRKKASSLGQNGGEDEEVRSFAQKLTKIARRVAKSGKVSSGQRGLQWQATFLVPRGQRKAWDNVLRTFAGRWDGKRAIECTGPWPPYSFVASEHD